MTFSKIVVVFINRHNTISLQKYTSFMSNVPHSIPLSLTVLLIHYSAAVFKLLPMCYLTSWQTGLYVFLHSTASTIKIKRQLKTTFRNSGIMISPIYKGGVKTTFHNSGIMISPIYKGGVVKFLQ